ncbi:sigma-70 family RNA polymerase sigma factor [Leucobacter coleopterorum]|uniref:Sigma-70 family RNA polymerase sigma factor n=1 Tax=Leucobacter coleopterorum TaxID=2714933 RepID=A0ABX6JUC9_9MICO|nr:sigma-70 family RNA polymerase sigma factor [Leucobacter coleopterorum]QIM17901.1 sigma-70 family RNA polymerase sigma factor [Leucobacter coleopterorum]
MDIQRGKTQSTLAGNDLKDLPSETVASHSAAQNMATDRVLESVRADLNDLSDEDLLELSRRGNRAAYTVIWTRHSAAGLKSARYYSSELDEHDLVAEAYSRIYIAITRGGGPRTAFRTYLQVTIRNIANKWRNEHRSLVDLELAEQDGLVGGVEDGIDARADRSMMQTAFASLPTSWQEVLWYTEVLELKPQSVANKLKMTANSVSVLSFRARDGLRKAWIRAHLGEENLPKECADTIDRLPAYILGSQTEKRSQKIADHLSTCVRCRRIRDEADVAASRLHAVVLPLVLTGGIGAATLGLLTGAPSSASAASLGATGTAKTTVLGGSKLALIAGAGVLTIGAVVTAIVWSNAAQQPLSSPESTGATSLDEAQQSDPERTQPAAGAADAVGRDNWSTRPGEAETASLYSVPIVSDVDAPQFSFSENAVFATSVPLLTGYAAPDATVVLFISAPGGADGAGYEKLTAQATPAGSWAVNTESIADGAYTVRAYQQLADGSRSDTADRSFAVNSGLQLAVPIVSSVDDANNRLLPVVTGTGVPGAIVSVLVNGVANESAIASDGTWAVTTVRGGVVGSNQLTVRQRERSGQGVSAETAPTQFELLAPDVAVDSSGTDPVLVVTAIPGSSVTVTDGKGLTHRLTDTQVVNRIRVVENDASGTGASARSVSVVYTGDSGRRAGAPAVRQLEF